eukprot:scpid110424/ scgid4350/ PHD and RING finger domain-containing protein 1
MWSPFAQLSIYALCSTCTIMYAGKHQGKQMQTQIPVKDTKFRPDDEEEEEEVEEPPTFCEECGFCDREDVMLLCDTCDGGYHLDCLNPPLAAVPTGSWSCPVCSFIDTSNATPPVSDDGQEEEEEEE